jgi:hypothetical protein
MQSYFAFLGIVRGISWDGGDGVVAALEAALREEAPYDSGEVVVLGPIGFERCLLTADSVLGDDVLLEARRRGGHITIDDVRDAKGIPKTRELMDRTGIRSLLLLSLSEAGGLEGWVGLGRTYAYGFAGVSMHRLRPLAALAGLALQKARALSKLHKRLPILVSVTPLETEGAPGEGLVSPAGAAAPVPPAPGAPPPVGEGASPGAPDDEDEAEVGDDPGAAEARRESRAERRARRRAERASRGEPPEDSGGEGDGT